MARMPSAESDVTTPDGSVDFSGGVDSLSATTIASPENPNGLSRNELAWLINATVRDGGISPRSGWRKNATIGIGSALFQGAILYVPLTGDPYFIASIGGHIYQVSPDDGTFTDLSAQFGLFNPPTQPKAYFCQAEQFLVIQAGDNVTLPLFWDGTILRRSLGLTTSTPVGATVTIKNIDDAANVGKTVPAGNVFSGGIQIFNLSSFVIPAVGSTVTVACTSFSGATTFPSNNFKISITGTVLVTHLQATNVGVAVPSQDVLYSGGTGSLTSLAAFVLPANGASITVGFASISGTAPPSSFNYDLAISPGNFALCKFSSVSGGFTAGNFEVTAFSASSFIAGTIEIPAATAMDYFMGRLWYAQGRQYCAGDIVDGPSGSAAYNFTDSVLKVTENPLVVGGDGFIVPSNAGDITAIFHNANLDASLGQGQLFVATAKSIYSLTVPVTRADWIAANNSNQPLQTVAQKANGAVNDWSVTPVNGDNFFQSNEPAVRSLQQSIRYFGQWGNAQISANVFRLLKFNNIPLLQFASGIYFDNRLIETALPVQTPQGVIHKAMVVLDFMPISTFGVTSQSGSVSQPVWEGSYEGVQVLQLLSENFGTTQRAFALAVSPKDNSFELWEIITGSRFDTQDNRITFQIEFPAFTWGREFGLKKLVGAELWIDRLFGTVEFTMEYRTDGGNCWNPWHKWKECSSRGSQEDCPPSSYPATQHGTGYRETMTLPMPPATCASQQGRPTNVGFQFQPRITVHGYCRVRGLILHAQPVESQLYRSPVC